MTIARPLSEQHLGAYQRTRAEPLVDGLQDARRIRGKELRQWRSALADREIQPANVWLVGDSLTECYGTTDDYHKWPWLFRDAVQRMFRNGGAGFISARHGTTWTYSSNLDGKNTWSLVAGALVDSVDYGFGFGRRAAWLNTNAAYQITVDCDRFWLVYATANAAGTMTIDIDLGTGMAQQFTQATAVTSFSHSGRIWDSGPLTRGTHTIKVTATTAAVTLEGICVFDTDTTGGIHVWEGGHSGYTALAFDGTDTTNGVTGAADWLWPELGWQPKNVVRFTDGVGNGTTTFTSAAATFTARDVGEWISFNLISTIDKPTNGVAKITGFTNSTTVTLDRTVPTGSSLRFSLNRSEVATASLTAGSTTLTTTGYDFVAWDKGKRLVGPTGLQAGTYIRRVVDANTIILSDYATITQSGQTLRILNRQLVRATPDLICVEFGINELAAGVTNEEFKTAVRNLVAYAIAKSCSETAPSVMLLDLWAPGYKSDVKSYTDGVTSNVTATVTSVSGTFTQADVGKTITGVNIPQGRTVASVQSATQLTMSGNGSAIGTAAIQLSGSGYMVYTDFVTTSGQAIATSDTADWGPEDVGNVIYGPNLPTGVTVLSVQSNRQITMSLNATGTGTNTVTILSRAWQERHWLPRRVAMMELAEENGWALFDLFSLGGWISPTDPNYLTYDRVHTDNRGSQWVGDELNQILTGMPRQATIPQGIFDNKGEIIVGSAVDTANKLPAGIDGQALRAAPNAPLGVLWQDPGIEQSFRQIIATPGAATFTAVGLTAPIPTSSVAAIAVDAAGHNMVRIASATSGTAASVIWTANMTRSSHIPELSTYCSPNAATFSAARYWIGLFSATPVAAADPASIHAAAFRWSSDGAADLTSFWRTYTKDGTTATVKVTNSPIASAGVYMLRIEFVGTKGTNATSINFFVNDVLVSTHTTNLPGGAALNLTPYATVTPTAAAQKSLDIARQALTI
jgi:lysophospholipase L1-like esterase